MFGVRFGVEAIMRWYLAWFEMLMMHADLHMYLVGDSRRWEGSRLDISAAAIYSWESRPSSQQTPGPVIPVIASLTESSNVRVNENKMKMEEQLRGRSCTMTSCSMYHIYSVWEIRSSYAKRNNRDALFRDALFRDALSELEQNNHSIADYWASIIHHYLLQFRNFTIPLRSLSLSLMIGWTPCLYLHHFTTSTTTCSIKVKYRSFVNVLNSRGV